ncbi:MAG: T9SS type A sorting domain-containing protein [Bacteroidota bacterium]|nr:T9SS type A sorting domain-containing protein [Bacteroidota bacterium]
MKKTILYFALIFTFTSFAQDIQPDAVNTEKVIKKNQSLDKSSTVIWSEDFGNGFPTGWTRTASANGGFATANWEWSMDGSWGYWNGNQGASANSGINSTTASNGFLICDPDSANHVAYGQPSGSTYQYLNSYFTTSAISTLGYNNVSLEFEHSFRFNNSINLEVMISNDSISWYPYYVQGNATNNQASADPEYVSLNISNIAGNQQTVYIKIGWSARVYFWMIDDMKLVETPDHKLKLLESNYGGWNTTSPTSTSSYGLDYTFYPMNQVMANPYRVEGIVANLGGQTQNTKLNIHVTDAIGMTVLSTSTTDTLLAVGDTGVLGLWSGFTPTTPGPHEFKVWATSDSTMTDTLTMQSIVTDTIYGRDNGSQSSWYGLGRSCGGMIIGVYYDVFVQDQVSSISVFIDDQSVVGSDIFVSLYEIDSNNDKIYIDQSDDYTLQASDLNTWVTIPFFNPVDVFPPSSPAPGTPLAYMAAVGGYAHPLDTTTIAMSKYTEPATCYIQKNGCLTGSQVFGNWYWTSRVPMIRMNMGLPWSVDISEETLSSTSIYPNPTEGELYINFGNSQMHMVQIKNLMGQILYEQNFSGLLNTNIDLSSYDKGCYLITISNSNKSTTQKIILE